VNMPYISLEQLRALGDRSPDNESLMETHSILQLVKYRDTESHRNAPLSCAKIQELIESIIALRDALSANRRAIDAVYREGFAAGAKEVAELNVPLIGPAAAEAVSPVLVPEKEQAPERMPDAGE